MKLQVAGLAVLIAVSAWADVFNDSTGDIDAGLSNGAGTLDILSVEVTHDATDVMFSLTVGGDVSTTDWGKFMIGIATGGTGSTTDNGWGRPITLDSPIGGMDFWIGSWVDGGGGAQLWSYNGATWDLDTMGSYSACKAPWTTPCPWQPWAWGKATPFISTCMRRAAAAPIPPLMPSPIRTSASRHGIRPMCRRSAAVG